MRFGNAALAHDTKIPKEDDDGGASCTIPKGTTYTIAVSNKDAAEQCCTPEPGLPIVRYFDVPG